MILPNPWMLLGVALAIAAAAAGGYKLGRDVEQGRIAEERVSVLTSAVVQVARIGDAMTKIGDRLAVALDASRERESAAVRVVREVVRDDPDFGAVRRPERLGRLRHEQLDAINRAAGSD